MRRRHQTRQRLLDLELGNEGQAPVPNQAANREPPPPGTPLGPNSRAVSMRGSIDSNGGDQEQVHEPDEELYGYEGHQGPPRPRMSMSFSDRSSSFHSDHSQLVAPLIIQTGIQDSGLGSTSR
jgi:hypothetical protein